jgi:dTMP kinase
MKGKLIVIDGPDSVGKTTQTELLLKRLRKAGYKTAVVSFPRYGKESAELAEEYLKGTFGSADKLGPYIPSFFFALDRFAAAPEIKKALSRGEILVSNRYVTASMAHQGLKIRNQAQRQKFYSWLMDLEYNVLGLPKPDVNVFLHMPYRISQRLMKNRKGKKKDIHENDLSHLKRAELTFLEIAKKYKYPVIDSAPKNQLLKPEQINDLLWQTLKLKSKV